MSREQKPQLPRWSAPFVVWTKIHFKFYFKSHSKLNYEVFLCSYPEKIKARLTFRVMPIINRMMREADNALAGSENNALTGSDKDPRGSRIFRILRKQEGRERDPRAIGGVVILRLVIRLGAVYTAVRSHLYFCCFLDIPLSGPNFLPTLPTPSLGLVCPIHTPFRNPWLAGYGQPT